GVVAGPPGARGRGGLPPGAGGALLEGGGGRAVAVSPAGLRPTGALLETCSRLQLAEPRRALSRALDAEAHRLLADVDRLLAAEEPYRPRQGGFAWWAGSQSPALAAWSVHDPAELAAYLEPTRD